MSFFTILIFIFLAFWMMTLSSESTRLKKRCKAMEKELKALKEEGTQKRDESNSITSDLGVLAIFLLGLFVFIAISCVIVALSFGSPKSNEEFDFGAYFFPGVAAICGGFGLYIKDKEKPFFLTACIFIVLGLLSYLFSKKENLPHVFATSDGIYSIMWLAGGLSGILFSVVYLVADVINNGKWSGLDRKHKTHRILGITGLTLFILSFPFYVYAASDSFCSLKACPAYEPLRKLLEWLV